MGCNIPDCKRQLVLEPGHDEPLFKNKLKGRTLLDEAIQHVDNIHLIKLVTFSFDLTLNIGVNKPKNLFIRLVQKRYVLK